LISTLFSCLDEPSVLEGILIMKHFYFSDNPELSKEAVGIVICCLSRSTKCYKQWVSNLFWSRSILRSCKVFLTSFMENKKIHCKRFFFSFRNFIYTQQSWHSILICSYSLYIIWAGKSLSAQHCSKCCNFKEAFWWFGGASYKIVSLWAT
jgi:hypothetical protein